MTRRQGALLVAASAAYVSLVVTAAGQLGVSYEEVVPYILTPLDIRDSVTDGVSQAATPRFVVSGQLPRLAFEPRAGMRLPLLNQPYMTDHLSYGGVALATAGINRLSAARLWHASFGLLLLWILFDVALTLGIGSRAALVAVAIASTSLPFTFMYTWARFDESLASFASVTVLWAALRYSGDQRQRWLWVAVIAAGLGVSGKLTTLWPLAGLAAAAGLGGAWRPPSLRALVAPAMAAAPLFAPVVGFAVAGPATGQEALRRIGFLTDLFTTDAIPGTAANLIDYLGSWGSILSVIIRGTDGHPANVGGWLLVSGALIWLIVRALVPGSVPRRRRLETQMLTVLAVVFTLVALFYREHRDYQFVLLVPLDAIALAIFLESGARILDRRLPTWAAAMVVCALPIGLNLWDQWSFREDLLGAQNAMFDWGAQHASAAWLAEQSDHRPIVVTFYAVGIYEFLTNGLVRPVYTFPLMRGANFGPPPPTLKETWRQLLSEGDNPVHLAVLPVGQNPLEARHFDEPAIATALQEVAQGDRVAVFTNPRGDPLLEIWQVRLRPSGSAGTDRQQS